MRDEPGRGPFSFDFFGGLTEGERSRLCKDVGYKHVLMPSDRIQRLAKSDKVTWDQPGPLMDQLIKRVLSVCSRFAPVNGACLIRNGLSIGRDVLTVAFHGQLLQICRET